MYFADGAEKPLDNFIETVTRGVTWVTLFTLHWHDFKGGLRKDDLVKSMAALHYFFRYACIYLGRLHNYYRVSKDLRENNLRLWKLRSNWTQLLMNWVVLDCGRLNSSSMNQLCKKWINSYRNAHQNNRLVAKLHIYSFKKEFLDFDGCRTHSNSTVLAKIYIQLNE